jgi:hypothetical protein
MSDSGSVSTASTEAILGSASSEELEDNGMTSPKEEGCTPPEPGPYSSGPDPLASDDESDGEAEFAFVYRKLMTPAERTEYSDYPHTVSPAPFADGAAEGEPLTRHAWVSVVAGARRVRIRGFWRNTCYEEETVNPAYMAVVPNFVEVMLKKLWARASRE